MIARLRGTLLESNFSGCVVEAAGVGYDVQIALSTFEKLPHPGGETSLFIHTQVREDAITLYGFATAEERELFRVLIAVSGIGGKLALSVLSTLSVNNFCAAVANNDIKLLSRIPGIGKRTAERLAVELKGKLSTGGTVFAPVEEGADSGVRAVSDAALALEQLGYKREAIDRTLKSLAAENQGADSETLLRQAIIMLNH